MENTVANAFARIMREGDVTVHYPSGRVQKLGDGDVTATGQAVVVRLSEKAVRQLAWDPVLAIGETYMDGEMTFEEGDFFSLLTFLKKGGVAKGWTPGAVVNHLMRAAKNGVRQRAGVRLAQRNIAHHYDLSEALFRLFLDDDMNYSCAYFEHERQGLEDAQRAKQRHIAAKLLSAPGARTLDIGSGWGGMGLYLAGVCGHDVTGVTLSVEQQRVANARAAERGVAERLKFELKDYREVQGTFDHITSIGMLEHVGLPQMKTYFKTVARLLDKHGTALIHTMIQPRPQPYAAPFGDKYIFPGGYVPALSEVLPAIEKAGLLVKDVEVLPLHYAETCRHWRERFHANRDAVLKLYDERFLRMWEVYLVGADLGFRHDRIYVGHFQLCRHQDRVPIRRDWIDEEKSRLRQSEAVWDAAR
ncbi:SAM-dependent methyltransferase [Algicella marina]|uniref:Methyltransferase domain-containing protein n=1 Tax=Algicella marina TaxID=2683284 RepID=A0A6P1SXJ2_9RHOB|nr:cyclopropane-fatty-acyl-phospholipid synthase family protein [Algicella marina]QHQ33729.1 methyltransferase domain-containing protein [Algicella marina]